jgi:hypothetical protein
MRKKDDKKILFWKEGRKDGSAVDDVWRRRQRKGTFCDREIQKGR